MDDLRKKIRDYLTRASLEELKKQSNDECRKWCSDDVLLRAIIEFSNYCRRDCYYCGIRKSNTVIERYRMSKSEIVAAAVFAVEQGYKTVVLQSGEDDCFSSAEICRIIEQIKQKANCAVTLCVGEKTYAEYQQFKNAGADRYLLKFETSNPDIFKKIKPDSNFKQRLECLEWLKQLGFQVGSGFMVGVPGQTLGTLTEDIILTYKLDLDMIGIGPFIAHAQTPLAAGENGDMQTTLRVIAAIRLITKNTHLPATTALGSINSQGRQEALKFGANVIMSNFTPQEYRQKYEIYPNKICMQESPGQCAHCVAGIAHAAGKKIDRGIGHSLKIKTLCA